MRANVMHLISFQAFFEVCLAFKLGSILKYNSSYYRKWKDFNVFHVNLVQSDQDQVAAAK